MNTTLFKISMTENYTFDIEVSSIILAIALIVLFVLWIVEKRFWGKSDFFEVNEAEIGVGAHKLKIRPNNEDRQIAYKLYVELSTRKLGLPIDLEHDVIVEIFNSWYEFFKITRELVKEIPATKVRKSKSTKDITKLSIDVLNEGLRPVLTKWQARFRHWYDLEAKDEDSKALPPQKIQCKFPDYVELQKDLKDVNKKLLVYREKLKQLSIGC